jgi:hypothetical protein
MGHRAGSAAQNTPNNFDAHELARYSLVAGMGSQIPTQCFALGFVLDQLD